MESPEPLDNLEESKEYLECDQLSEQSQALDPLKIHFKMQEDALKAKKAKQQMIQKKRLAKLLEKQKNQKPFADQNTDQHILNHYPHGNQMVPQDMGLNPQAQQCAGYFSEFQREQNNQYGNIISSSETFKTSLSSEDKENKGPTNFNIDPMHNRKIDQSMGLKPAQSSTSKQADPKKQFPAMGSLKTSDGSGHPSAFGMQQSHLPAQGAFLTPEKNQPLKSGTQDGVEGGGADPTAVPLGPTAEPQSMRPAVQQQNGDGTFYINNITNNIILDKSAKQANGTDRGNDKTHPDATRSAAETKKKATLPHETPSTASLQSETKCHCALKYSAGHHMTTPGSNFSNSGSNFYSGGYGYGQNPHQFYPYPFGMVPGLGMFGPGFGQYGPGHYSPPHFAGNPYANPYSMQP